MKRVLLLALILMGFVFLFSFLNTGEEKKDKIYEISAEIKAGEESYLIILEEKEIVLYKVNGEKKERIKKSPASPLRKKDEEILEKGIFTKKMEEALMIFEDFIS